MNVHELVDKYQIEYQSIKDEIFDKVSDYQSIDEKSLKKLTIKAEMIKKFIEYIQE